MRVAPTSLPGVMIVEPHVATDDRGSFRRVWDLSEFRSLGLNGTIDQANVSHNRRRGTLRGLHWQDPPHEEAKLVRCTRGRAFDVAVQIRPGPTYLQWLGIELDPESGRGLYVPPGFAHGFLTLEDDTDIEYLMTGDYQPGHARGLRYDDPAVAVDWPIEVAVVSDRDLGFPRVEGP